MLQNHRKHGTASSFKTAIYFFFLIILILISFSTSRKYSLRLNEYRSKLLEIINSPVLKFESVFFSLASPIKENEVEELRIKLLASETQNITNEKTLNAANKLLKNNFRQKNILLITPTYYSSNGFLTDIIFLKHEGQEVIPNMAVISGEGVYGRVAKVQKNAVNIISIFNASSRIPVYTKNSQIYGMAAGNGLGITFIYNNLNAESFIDEEEVLSSGENNLLLPDLPIGQIKKVGKKVYIIPFGKQRPLILGIIQN